MARTDRAAFLGVLRDAEGEMDGIFDQMAKDIGQVVMRAAGPEGTVPVERLQDVRRQARRIVDAAFVGARSGKPFDEDNRPLAPYPEVIAGGQLAMIDLALERAATIVQRYMPEDVLRGMAARRLTGGG